MKRLVNDKLVELTVEEKESEKRYHISRIAFAFVYGELELLINDERDHMQWLREDFSIKDKAIFDSIVRGYIKCNEIYLYKTSNFYPIENSELTLDMIHSLLNIARVKSNNEYKSYIFYNGVKVGKIGEQWKPIEKLLEIDV